MSTTTPTGAGTSSASRGSQDQNRETRSSQQSGDFHSDRSWRENVPLQPSLDTSSSRQSGGQRSGDTATALKEGLSDTARSATRAVQQQASELASNIGQELNKTAEDQKLRGVEAMQTFANAIKTAAGEMENQSPLVASYIRDAANRVEGLSGSIKDKDVTELLKAATDLARSQPVLFFGGAIAAGFALSRFLKSSARNHGEMSSSSSEMSSSGMSGSRSRTSPMS